MIRTESMEDLISVISEQVFITKELIKCADEHKQALTTFQMNDLEVAVKKQEELGLLMQSLEKRRIAIIVEAFGVQPIQATKISLSEIISHSDAEFIPFLTEKQRELRFLSAQLTDKIRTNRLLAERGKRFIAEMTKALTQDGSTIYSRRM